MITTCEAEECTDGSRLFAVRALKCGVLGLKANVIIFQSPFLTGSVSPVYKQLKGELLPLVMPALA